MRHATELIIRAFDEHDIRYEIRETEEASVAEAKFTVRAGPEVTARFISDDEDNDVAVRIYSLVNRVPDGKRADVLEACNRLNAEVRFFKFYLDGDSNVNVEADLPVETGDECVGMCCFELFVRAMGILENEFHVFGEALFSGQNSAESRGLEVLRRLHDLQDRPIVIDEGEPA